MTAKNFHNEQKNFKNKFGFEIDFRATVGGLKKENELLKRKLELESVKRMHYEQKFFQLKAKELGYNE